LSTGGISIKAMMATTDPNIKCLGRHPRLTATNPVTRPHSPSSSASQSNTDQRTGEEKAGANHGGHGGAGGSACPRVWGTRIPAATISPTLLPMAATEVRAIQRWLGNFTDLACAKPEIISMCPSREADSHAGDSAQHCSIPA
jgi:hypothetical protein